MEKQMNTPTLRFPEFNGEWEKQLGSKVFEPISNKTHNSDLPILAISQEFGAVPREMINYQISVSEKSIDGYKVIEKGDFIISLRSFQGGIEYSNYKGICSPAYIILRSKLEINDNFYKIYFKTNKYIQNLCSKLEGIRDGKMISYKYFSEITIPFPTLPEQTKIAEFFTAIDAKIQALKIKKEKLQQYKKGVMQRIFSAGMDRDAINRKDVADADRDAINRVCTRFKDENGKDFPAWEMKKLGEVLDYEQPTNYLVSSTEYEDKFETPVVTAGKTFILGYTDETNGIFKDNLPVIIFDDFTTATQFVNFPFKAKSSAMKILKAKENSNIKFIYEAMQMIDYETGGHGRHWISVFAEMEISIPCIKEQTKIANFLSSIDEKINHTETQIQQTQMWKKGLLQKMFV